MKKNIFKILCLIFIFSLSFILIGCGEEKKVNDIEILSFEETNGKETTQKETALLKIKLKNYYKYSIKNIEINEEFIEFEKEENNETYNYSASLILGLNKFTITKIVYEKNNEDKIFVCNIELNISRENISTQLGEVSLKTFVIKEKEENKEIFYNDPISITLTFNNPNKYLIKTFKLNGTKKIINTDVIDEYTFKEKATTNSITITEIEYKKNDDYIVLSNVVQTVSFDILQKDVYVDKFEIVDSLQLASSYSSLGEKKKAYAVNSTITFSVRVVNEDKLKITKFIIHFNNENYEINNFSLFKESLFGDTYTFGLKINSISEDIKEFYLVGVEYENSEKEKLVNPFTENKVFQIDIYNKLIKTWDDFISINDNPNGKYLLCNDIKANASKQALIDDFSGILNGDGYAIDFNGYSYNNAIFNTIGKNALLKNVKFTSYKLVNNESGTKTAIAVLANTNSGKIQNIEVSNSNILNTKNNSNLKSSLLVLTNNGIISDCVVSSTQSTEIVLTGDLFGIAEDNNGTIQKVIVKINGVKKANGDNLLNNIYFTIKNNNDDATFVNSYSYSTLKRDQVGNATKVVYSASTKSETSILYQIFFVASFKETSGFYDIVNQDKKYIYVPIGNLVNNDNVDEMTREQMSDATFHDALGFNVGTTEDIYWHISGTPYLLFTHEKDRA